MVIRMRHTRSHTKNRRSHHALKNPALSTCANCSADTRPHHMCLECGHYNGRQVMDLAAQKAKRDARLQAKRERISSETAAAPEEAEQQSAETPAEETPKEEKAEKKSE